MGAGGEMKGSSGDKEASTDFLAAVFFAATFLTAAFFAPAFLAGAFSAALVAGTFSASGLAAVLAAAFLVTRLRALGASPALPAEGCGRVSSLVLLLIRNRVKWLACDHMR